VLWRITTWTGCWSCKLLTFPAATYFLLHTHCTCFAHVLCRTDWVHFARCLSESISICCKLWAVKSMSYPWNAESLSPWSWINWGRMQLLELTIGSIVWANHGLLSSIPPHLSLSLSPSLCVWPSRHLWAPSRSTDFHVLNSSFFFENQTMHLIRWVSCLSYAWMCSKFVCALLMACWPIWEAYEKCFMAQLTKWCLQVTVYTILTKIGITYNIKSNNM
jgi:hypothetical protein